MATTVNYNGVTLKNVQTRRFVEEAVRDDSGTDILYHRFTIRVLGVVHTYVQGTGGGGPTIVVDSTVLGTKTNNAVLNQIAIRQALMEDRGTFVMSLDGTTILQANGQGLLVGTVQNLYADVNNGPKPKSCEVVHIAGSNAFRIEFEIEICMIDCGAANDNTLGVLNNRWSIEDDIDQDWYTLRTIRGRIRLGGGTISGGAPINPHMFRGWVLPTLQPGFKRESIQIVASPDGLAADYTAVDRQVYVACPAPATTWTAEHSVFTGDGATTNASLNVTVSGPPQVAKSDLINLCATLAVVKLALKGANAGNVLQSCAIVDHLDSNTVDFRAEVLTTAKYESYTPSNPAGASMSVVLAMNMMQFGEPLNSSDFPNYDPDTSQATPPFGQTTLAGLIACYLQTPCNNVHGMPQVLSNTGTSPPSPNPTGPPVTVTQKPLATIDDQNLSDSHGQALYTHYRIQPTYGTPQGIVQVPYSQANLAGQTSAFVSVCAPSSWRIVRVEAERLGMPPQFPLASDTTMTLASGLAAVTVMDFKITPEAPDLMPDGYTYKYRASAEYTYAFDRPLSPADTLVAGSLPWTTSSLSSDVLPTSAFQAGIIS